MKPFRTPARTAQLHRGSLIDGITLRDFEAFRRQTEKKSAAAQAKARTPLVRDRPAASASEAS